MAVGVNWRDKIKNPPYGCKIAVYAGSFDPVTKGHLHVIKTALEMFDYLFIGVGENVNKTPLYAAPCREDQISGALTEYDHDMFNLDAPARSKFCIKSYTGLLVNFASKMGAKYIVRGMRALSDFDMEFNLNGVNKQINPNIETVFLMAPAEFMFVSSSVIKEMNYHGADISQFVTPSVQCSMSILHRKRDKP